MNKTHIHRNLTVHYTDSMIDNNILIEVFDKEVSVIHKKSNSATIFPQKFGITVNHVKNFYERSKTLDEFLEKIEAMSTKTVKASKQDWETYNNITFPFSCI